MHWAILLGLGGCAKATAPAVPTSAAPDESAWIALPKLNAQIEMPRRTRVTDVYAEGWSTDPVIYLLTEVGTPPPYDTIRVWRVSESDPQTLEAAIQAVKDDTNGFHTLDRVEENSEGWVLEYEGESEIGDGPLFGVTVRKRVGDWVGCEGHKLSRTERDTVTTSCRSIAAR